MQSIISMIASICSIQGIFYNLSKCEFVEEKMVEPHVDGYSNVEKTGKC